MISVCLLYVISNNCHKVVLSTVPDIYHLKKIHGVVLSILDNKVLTQLICKTAEVCFKGIRLVLIVNVVLLQVLAEAPLCHKNAFKYMCAFLRQLLEESKYNNLDIKYLGEL